MEEELGELTQKIQALSGVVRAFSALKDRAKPEGASEKFTLELNQAIIDMQSIVINAQDAALTAQTREASLTSRIAELEQEVVGFKDWDEVAGRYVLSNVDGGEAIAYRLPEEMKKANEPMHYICASCYESHVKSILQPLGSVMECPKCAYRVTRPGHDAAVTYY